MELMEDVFFFFANLQEDKEEKLFPPCDWLSDWLQSKETTWHREWQTATGL